MSDFDILIVGGGIAGASLGALLAGRARVAIVETEHHCAMHSTGRSAAFWLASYGGPQVMPLTLASRPFFDRSWPGAEASLLRPRGAIFIARSEEDLATALADSPAVAPDRFQMDRAALEQEIPGLSSEWNFGVAERSCADIAVAELHQACLRQFQKAGGTLLLSSGLERAHHDGRYWRAQAGIHQLTSRVIVNAAGAWADEVAIRCGLRPIGLLPMRRTMIQLRVAQSGLKQLPLVLDARGGFYFKGEGEHSVWLTPHDETETHPCDAAPEELDVAIAMERFQSAVDWAVDAVERKWAGLRTFAPDRVPIYGFDPDAENFFWCAGQGGFGIQTAPAAAHLAAALLLEEEAVDAVAHIDPAPFAPGRFRKRP